MQLTLINNFVVFGNENVAVALSLSDPENFWSLEDFEMVDCFENAVDWARSQN